MRKVRWSAIATIVALLAILCALTISFLPFFVREAWPALWDPALQPASRMQRSFGGVGPWCHVLPWPALLAIPIASLLLVSLFVIVSGATLLRRR